MHPFLRVNRPLVEKAESLIRAYDQDCMALYRPYRASVAQG